MRSIESESVQALWMRYVCSMYSVILCKKLSGSLKTIGIVILDSSCKDKVFPDRNGLVCGQRHHNLNNMSLLQVHISCFVWTEHFWPSCCLVKVACADHSNAFLQEAPYTEVISGEHGRWKSRSEHKDTHINSSHSLTDKDLHFPFPEAGYCFLIFGQLTASPTLHSQTPLCHSLSACSHRHRHL